MMSAELYQKTVTGHEASPGKGESISLSRYCKPHHITILGMMCLKKKHTIDPPGAPCGRPRWNG